MYLWRAIDHEGAVLEILVQRRRDRSAAVKLMRKLLRKSNPAFSSGEPASKRRSPTSADAGFRTCGEAHHCRRPKTCTPVDARPKLGLGEQIDLREV
jgi:hypothetical protein